MNKANNSTEILQYCNNTLQRIRIKNHKYVKIIFPTSKSITSRKYETKRYITEEDLYDYDRSTPASIVSFLLGLYKPEYYI